MIQVLLKNFRWSELEKKRRKLVYPIEMKLPWQAQSAAFLNLQLQISAICLFLLSQNERLLPWTFQFKLTQLHPMINSIFCCVQELVSKHLLQAKLCTLWASTRFKNFTAFRSSMLQFALCTHKKTYSWQYEF